MTIRTHALSGVRAQCLRRCVLLDIDGAEPRITRWGFRTPETWQ